jgi:hemolysin activation/secretion protein
MAMASSLDQIGPLGGSVEDDINATKLHSGGEFMYYTGDVMRIQSISEKAYVVLRGTGQWTPDSLTSLEQFRVGGAYSVRGYPESDASGDYGYQFSLEYRAPIEWIPANWTIPGTNKLITDTLQFYIFLDGGKVFTRERTTSTEEKDKFIIGSGVGLKIHLGVNQSFDIAWGFPMGEDSSDKDRNRVHLTAIYGY